MLEGKEKIVDTDTEPYLWEKNKENNIEKDKKR